MIQAAVRSFTESLRLELEQFDVHVVLVEPTSYKTHLADYEQMKLMLEHNFDKAEPGVQRHYEHFKQFMCDSLAVSHWVSQFVDVGRNSDLNEVGERPLKHALTNVYRR